jgi:hypothetical protein
MAIKAGLREKILMIDEPIFEGVFWHTALNMAKFSMPHVSGIHTVSGLYVASFSTHLKRSEMERSEPKLYDSFMLLPI